MWGGGGEGWGGGGGGRAQLPGYRSGADGGKGQNLGEAQWKPGRGRNAKLLKKAAERREKLKSHWGGNLVSLTRGWEGSRELGLISGAQWPAGGGGLGQLRTADSGTRMVFQRGPSRPSSRSSYLLPAKPGNTCGKVLRPNWIRQKWIS